MPLKIKSPTLSHDRLLAVLWFDAETGTFTWKQRLSHKGRVGAQAGSRSERGYLRISIDGERLLAHRLAWFYAHGKWPIEQLDHVNSNPADNRITNLREASHTQNIQHRKRLKSQSGLKGAHLVRASGRWRAAIDCDGKKHTLGTFATAEEAHAVYCAAAKRLHGEFAKVA